MKEAEKGKILRESYFIGRILKQLILKTLFPFLYDYESDKNTSHSPSWDKSA